MGTKTVLLPLVWHNEKRKVKELVPYEFNPRKLSEEKKQLLINSIEKYNLAEVPAINTDNVIIAGHQRIKVLMEIGRGEEEIDVRVPNRLLTEVEFKEYNITSNIPVGFWDVDVLEEHFKDVNLEDLGLFMAEVFIPEEEPEVLEAEEDDFDVPVGGSETDIVLGDLFEIGNHRLLCGDSTCSDTVAKLMNGEKADMVFTDPPYGIDYSGGRTGGDAKPSFGKLMNDDLQGVELGDLISNVFLFNKQNADVYICVSPKMQKPFLDFIENSNKKIDAVIVWDKKQPGLGYMAYRRQCEFILFIKGGAFKKGDNSDFDLWSISRDNGQDYVHGTQKPIGVPSRAINNSSKTYDLVLDYFGGSGSTMVASHYLKRKCYEMELDPKYCQVIVDRMLKLNPDIIIKRNGEKYIKKVNE